MSFPSPLQHLMEQFRKHLPGVGPKAAERFTLALAKDKNGAVDQLIQSLNGLKVGVQTCSLCYTFANQSPCSMCTDKQRDHSKVCVIAEPQDLVAIERTGEYKGLYHVLGGLLSPISGITPKHLTIDALVQRAVAGGVKEIVIAFDSTMDGEATVVYLKKLLSTKGARVTRLARGLPMGSDLEYADEITLTDAIRGRREG